MKRPSQKRLIKHDLPVWVSPTEITLIKICESISRLWESGFVYLNKWIRKRIRKSLSLSTSYKSATTWTPIMSLGSSTAWLTLLLEMTKRSRLHTMGFPRRRTKPSNWAVPRSHSRADSPNVSISTEHSRLHWRGL